jgi:REP element-mobilizing transposase RayT
MVRGIERRRIFETTTDRQDFVTRLEAVVKGTGLRVFAWALLPNHVHLLVRTGPQPLATAMRRLLTGYAVAFNHRHKRHGHLFQNRYKSVLVEEEPYLLELTRYIHLNPFRARVVRSLAELDRYPWTGHSAVMGHVPRRFHAVTEVLGAFDRSLRTARRQYREFVSDGMSQGRRPELQGGGLRRSTGGWESLTMLRRGREGWAFDERVLGSGPFVDQVLRSLPAPATRSRAEAIASFLRVLGACAAAWGVTPAEVCGGSRRRVAAQARAAASYVGVSELGLPIVHIARTLGVSPPVVRAGLARGAEMLRVRGICVASLLAEASSEVS